MPDIDFAAIKAAVNIATVADFLGLKLRPDKAAFRCPCPICKRAGDRAIIITPSEGKWYCHGTCKTGGDSIKLTAHVRGTNQTEAAKFLHDAFMRQPEPEKPKRRQPRQTGKTAKSRKPTPSVYNPPDPDEEMYAILARR